MGALSVIFAISMVHFCTGQLAGSFDYPQSVTLNNGIQRYPAPDSSLKLDHGHYPGGQLPGQPRDRRGTRDIPKSEAVPARHRRDADDDEPEEILAVPLPAPLPDNNQLRHRRNADDDQPEEILAVPLPAPLPDNNQLRHRRDADDDQPENILAVPLPAPLPEKQPRSRRDTKGVLAVTIPQLIILTEQQERERRQAVPIPQQLPNPDGPQRTTF